MNSIRSVFSVASMMALFLILASGCNLGSQKPALLTKCQGNGAQTFVVDPHAKHGVNPPDVYVCEGDTVEWKDNGGGHHFTVDFENNESPFSDGQTHFDNTNGNPKSKGAIKITGQGQNPGIPVAVFKFTIVIDGGTRFDPHVVVGGGY